jgi:hypothetical protein
LRQTCSRPPPVTAAGLVSKPQRSQRSRRPSGRFGPWPRWSLDTHGSGRRVEIAAAGRGVGGRTVGRRGRHRDCPSSRVGRGGRDRRRALGAGQHRRSRRSIGPRDPNRACEALSSLVARSAHTAGADGGAAVGRRRCPCFIGLDPVRRWTGSSITGGHPTPRSSRAIYRGDMAAGSPWWRPRVAGVAAVVFPPLALGRRWAPARSVMAPTRWPAPVPSLAAEEAPGSGSLLDPAAIDRGHGAEHGNRAVAGDVKGRMGGDLVRDGRANR